MNVFLTIVLTLGLLMVPVLGMMNGAAAEAAASNHKILVAYFSHSGTTKKVAGRIAQETGGTLFEIQPSVPYPNEYQACLDRASKEVAEKARPGILSRVENMEAYDVVFVGFPIWWYNAPMIMDTFMESYDFAGKTVIPFCTSGGSPIGVAMDKIKLHCPKAKVLDGLTANGGVNVEGWVQKLGYGR